MYRIESKREMQVGMQKKRTRFSRRFWKVKTFCQSDIGFDMYSNENRCSTHRFTCLLFSERVFLALNLAISNRMGNANTMCLQMFILSHNSNVANFFFVLFFDDKTGITGGCVVLFLQSNREKNRKINICKRERHIENSMWASVNKWCTLLILRWSQFRDLSGLHFYLFAVVLFFFAVRNE